MATYEYETRLNCSVDGLFDFLSRPGNVSKVTSPNLGITFHSAPEVVHEGARLDFQVITFGQIIKSSHQILEFERPRLVVERQIAGPMKSWLHRHEYEAVPEGVLKRDIVEFQLPGGLIGLLLSESKICSHLEDGFYYREQRLQELIASGELR
ncbi:Ligand-binding SRPBCC domain-containing protein [Planctomicrobium piriforme]|uniref:Ligand-binding SRPBCC domain-containing protein n=2 Tax=Planctomicrobium piriforme TaxID=1576369 RepID=A0A1I3LP97_9PLAN|nr:Ligand-binding SRPBCC domain-containing protein [Planctomicrobium piriforme]